MHDDSARARVREAGGAELLERLDHLDAHRSCATPAAEAPDPPDSGATTDYDVALVGGGLWSNPRSDTARARPRRRVDRARVGAAHREWNASGPELRALVAAGLVTDDELFGSSRALRPRDVQVSRWRKLPRHGRTGPRRGSRAAARRRALARRAPRRRRVRRSRARGALRRPDGGPPALPDDGRCVARRHGTAHGRCARSGEPLRHRRPGVSDCRGRSRRAHRGRCSGRDQPSRRRSWRRSIRSSVAGSTSGRPSQVVAARPRCTSSTMPQS